MVGRTRAWLLSGALVVVPSGLAQAGEAPHLAAADPTLEARAKALEIQLIAPCCNNQTLDVHDSPVVDSMKQEIRARLAAGDAPEAILRGFEEKYGPSVRAVSSDGSANVLGGALSMAGAAGALGAILTLRRWRRRGASAPGVGATPPAPGPGGAASSVSDERLDRELAELDR